MTLPLPPHSPLAVLGSSLVGTRQDAPAAGPLPLPPPCRNAVSASQLRAWTPRPLPSEKARPPAPKLQPSGTPILSLLNCSPQHTSWLHINIHFTYLTVFFCLFYQNINCRRAGILSVLFTVVSPAPDTELTINKCLLTDRMTLIYTKNVPHTTKVHRLAFGQ